MIPFCNAHETKGDNDSRNYFEELLQLLRGCTYFDFDIVLIVI